VDFRFAPGKHVKTKDWSLIGSDSIRIDRVFGPKLATTRVSKRGTMRAGIAALPGNPGPATAPRFFENSLN
jgi:hypothetical protein